MAWPWLKVSDWAIIRGKQAISKKSTPGGVRYALFDGEAYAGYYESAASAKEAADLLLAPGAQAGQGVDNAVAAR
jgi:hypothetical protein